MIFRAILFDFDGVLGNTMADNYAAWHHALKELGIALQQEEYYVLEGMSARDVAITVLTKNGYGLEYVEGVCRSKETHYRLNNRFAFYPSVIELVTGLAARGMCLGLVTGANLSRLQQTVPGGFLDLFQTVVTGDQVSRAKPDPQFYLLAANSLGVSPDQCLVVENAPLGIDAAKGAGMYCIAIQSTLDETYLTSADEIFDNLAAVGHRVNALLEGMAMDLTPSSLP